MDQNEKVAALIKHGGGIAGGVVGGVLGFLAGGPIVAAIGGAIGSAVQTAASELAARELSRREAMRVGATMSYAIDFIRERLARGDVPREDKFFDTKEQSRSPAEEIFEGALLQMKNEHEEQKARFYGQLFTNVAFDPSCSRSEANYLLHLMENLTFHQLSLMSLYSDGARFPLPNEGYDGKNISFDVIHLLVATFELCQTGLIQLVEKGEKNGTAVLDPLEIRPACMILTAIGRRLFDLAGLAAIGDGNELDNLVRAFNSAGPESAGATVNRALLRNQ